MKWPRFNANRDMLAKPFHVPKEDTVVAEKMHEHYWTCSYCISFFDVFFCIRFVSAWSPTAFVLTDSDSPRHVACWKSGPKRQNRAQKGVSLVRSLEEVHTFTYCNQIYADTHFYVFFFFLGDSELFDHEWYLFLGGFLLSPPFQLNSDEWPNRDSLIKQTQNWLN